MENATQNSKKVVPFGGRLRVFATNPESHFQNGFQEIFETRMKGLPIINKKLQVKALEFRRWGNDWIGAIVTPWSVMIIWACGSREGWAKTKAGDSVEIELPAGDFAFLTAIDPILGEYRQLSLMSPVPPLEDQAAAELFAQVALKTILTIPEDERDQFMEENEGTPLTPPSGNGKVIPIKAVAAKPKPATGAGSHPKAQQDQATVLMQADRKAPPAKPVTRRDFFKRYTGI